jgi:hypothetical protein
MTQEFFSSKQFFTQKKEVAKSSPTEIPEAAKGLEGDSYSVLPTWLPDFDFDFTMRKLLIFSVSNFTISLERKILSCHGKLIFEVIRHKFNYF